MSPNLIAMVYRGAKYPSSRAVAMVDDIEDRCSVSAKIRLRCLH
jgi:hypothetical protein